MRLASAALTALLSVALATSTAGAQGAASGPAFVPKGAYTMVPDSNYAGPDLSGLVVKFADDSTLVVSGQDGSLIVRSKIAFSGNTFTFNDVAGDNMCPAQGKYTMTGDEKTFRLVLQTDECNDRAGIVTSVKFVKSAG